MLGLPGRVYRFCPYCRTLVRMDKKVLGNWHWCELKRHWSNRRTP